MKRVLFLGYGEVGSSLYKLYTNFKSSYILYIKDLYRQNIKANEKIDILNVCIPYNNMFISSVVDNILEHKPYLTIIHSTIPLYTTEKVYEAVNTVSRTLMVHSPIMGVHPHLTESIKTFIKMVGGINDISATTAMEHLTDIGITVVKFNSSRETEMTKLLSTTYYAWNIVFMKKVHELCEKLELNFEQVYTMSNLIYNDGYKMMEKENVIRPVLKNMHKGIGGHCLVENTIILDERNMLPEITKIILNQGKNSNLKYKDRAWLYSEYIGKNKKIKKIGEECGVSSATIRKWLKKLSIPKK